MRNFSTAIICFTAFLCMTESKAWCQFDFGVLASVAEVTRHAPSAPTSATSPSIKMFMRSSAFILGDPAEGSDRVFLVTAAHNLCDCESIDVRNDLVTVHIPGSAQELKRFFYFDQAEDLAIFEWTDQMSNSFRRNDTLRRDPIRRRSMSSPGKIVAGLVNPKTPDDRRLPRGGIAAAAGTITGAGLAATYPAYSCTISRYVRGDDLHSALNDSYRVSFAGSDPESQFRRKVVDRISDQLFLVVESMSITVGFSGSPIMISNDYFFEQGDVVGIVIGGKPTDYVGRSAWAITANTIDAAIKVVKQANDGNTLRWTPLSNAAGRTLALEDPKSPGRLLGTVASISDLKVSHPTRFSTPFLNRFNNESRVEFVAEPRYTLCRQEFLRLTERLQGKSFTFRQFDFDEDCLDEITLLTPLFENCLFRSTRFRGAVLTGPRFVGCRLFHGSDEMDIREIRAQPCNSPDAICSPAAIVAASFQDEGGREIRGPLRVRQSTGTFR